ncbi:hypothetical protein ACCT24_24145 [Rhizobium ruizarguesonis]|nr:hypothetical protein [Rhizobium ruizarguesonis]
MGLRIEFNQSWVKSAAALLFFFSRIHSGARGSAEQSHSFDTGAS